MSMENGFDYCNDRLETNKIKDVTFNYDIIYFFAGIER